MATWLLVGLLSAAVLVGVLGMSFAPTSHQQHADAEVPHTLTRRSAAWRWGGVVAGAVVAVLAVESGALGRGLLLAAPLFGLCVLMGVLLGELSLRRPKGRTRRAAVEVRAVRDYLPRRLTRAVIGAGFSLAVMLLGTTAAGSPDDLNRAGRSLLRTCDPTHSESHGPWAGSFYSFPLALVVLIGVVTAALALRQIVRRPRPENAAGQIVSDDVLRRRAANAVIGACGVLVSIPLIGVCLVTAIDLLAIGCAPGWWTVTGWLLIASTSAWLGLLGWSAVAIFAPSVTAPRVRAVA